MAYGKMLGNIKSYNTYPGRVVATFQNKNVNNNI